LTRCNPDCASVWHTTCTSFHIQFWISESALVQVVSSRLLTREARVLS
jgi:hypothetical protein